MPLHLFAASDAEGMSTFTVLMAVVATVSALGSGFLSYLTARDKLRFDSQVIRMQDAIATLTEKVQVCQTERDELRVEVAELRKLVAGRSGPLAPLPPIP